jgi:alpha-beta hydrolase superfamily lysophospholipase
MSLRFATRLASKLTAERTPANSLRAALWSAAAGLALLVSASVIKTLKRITNDDHDPVKGDGREHPLFREYVTNAQGLRLFTRAWRAEKPKALVLIVHGFAEHSGRYTALAEALREAGYDVGALDLQGHGRSEGTRVHVRRFSDYVADVEIAAQYLKRTPEQKLVLLGHSMGGLTVIHAAATNQVSGVILSAPAVEPDPELVTPLLKAACRMLGRFLPKAPIEEIKAEALSRDLAVVDMYENDPLVFHGYCLARWGAEMLDAMDASMGKASKATAPLLAIHGSEDRVVKIEGTRQVLATWGGPTAAEIVEGAYHETFNELEREALYSRVSKWLDGVVA